MEIFKKLGTWCALVSGLTPLALNTPGLIPTGGKTHALLTFVMGAAGLIGSIFAKQLAGKSDELRLSETLPSPPQERATDPGVKP